MKVKKEYDKNGELYRESFYNENGEPIKRRVYESLSEGGGYTEAINLNDNRTVIRQCDENGNLKKEIFGRRSSDVKRRQQDWNSANNVLENTLERIRRIK